MGRRPAHEQGDTEAEIREAAFALFGRYGYDGVSIGAVAKAAAIAKSALYWHYDNKDALYIACLEHLQALFRRHVFEPMARIEDPAERILALFTGMVALLDDPAIRGGVAGYWLTPSTADLPQAHAALRGFEEEAAAYLARTLQAAIDEGSLAPELAAAEMADTVIAIMEAVILPMRLHGADHTRRVTSQLAHAFFRAYGADPALVDRAVAALAGPPERR